jgi:WS/DGAT/MGAT family acyltransferase
VTATKAIDTATKVSNKLIQNSLETLTNPTKLLDYAKQGTAGASALASVITYPSDPPTIFRGPLQIDKTVSWSVDISLDKVKAIKEVTKATVNDVLLTAMSGALRRYLVNRDQDVDGLNFRAAVPVNLRPLNKMNELGNQFGLVFLSLPVGIEDPLDRLWELKKRMDHLKNSGEAIITFGMLKAVGATPAEIQKLVVNTFGTKATCVMTNVPGPKTHLFLGGKRVDDIMFWVPCSGRVGMGISIFSYAGNVRLGIATDRGLIPDPSNIIDGFYQEMEAFGELVRQVES